MGQEISLYRVKGDFFQLMPVQRSQGFCLDAFHEIFRSFYLGLVFSEFLFLELGQKMTRIHSVSASLRDIITVTKPFSLFSSKNI